MSISNEAILHNRQTNEQTMCRMDAYRLETSAPKRSLIAAGKITFHVNVADIRMDRRTYRQTFQIIASLLPKKNKVHFVLF